MSKSIPEIKKFMTYNPITIQSSKTISEAQSIMKGEKIRHLPVVDEGKIVGIISDRDVSLLLGLVLSTPQSIKVRDILHSTVFSVHPDTLIDQVVDEMASKHYGCALVEDNGKLVGIFTHGDFARRYATDHEIGKKRIDSVMTRNPVTIREDALAAEALNVLQKRMIDDLVVVDAKKRPMGLIDSQDLPRFKLV